MRLCYTSRMRMMRMGAMRMGMMRMGMMRMGAMLRRARAGRVAAAVTLLMLALVSAAGCQAGTSAAPAAPRATTSKELLAAARASLETWRQAYEVRSLEALGTLYTHDPSLVVVHQGTAHFGWPSVEALLRDRVSRASSIRLRIKDVQVETLGPDAVSALATLTREVTEGATTAVETGTLTLILWREPGSAGRWLITHEHYSYGRS